MVLLHLTIDDEGNIFAVYRDVAARGNSRKFIRKAYEGYAIILANKLNVPLKRG